MDASKTTLPTYSLFGHRYDFTASLVSYSIFHRRFVMFFGMVIAILTLFDTHRYGDMLSIWQAALVWTLSVTLIVLLYVSAIFALLRLKRAVPGLVVYMPVVGVFSMVVSSNLTIHFAYFLTLSPVPQGVFWQHLPFNIAAVLIFETLFLIYVAPILRRAEKRAQQKKVATRRVIAIGDREIPVAEILYLQAQDHYVNLHLRGGEVLMPRARLRDIVRQLKPEDGALVHRSYWVAWSGLVSYKTTSEAHTLTMSNGANVPVAKGRKHGVEQGLHAYAGGVCAGGSARSG